jgi:hypothetical protein
LRTLREAVDQSFNVISVDGEHRRMIGAALERQGRQRGIRTRAIFSAR